MTKVEDVAEQEPFRRSEVVLRLVCLCLCLVLYSFGYAAGVILSLPLPVPDNMVSLLFALTKDAFFSKQTMVFFAVAASCGRPLERPSPSKGPYLKFPGWLLKQPYAGIGLGVTIFISPLLIAIGFSGISYILAVGFILYFTPTLLSLGLAGAAPLLTASALAGLFLAKLAFFIPIVKACEGDKSVKLYSGAPVPCEDYVYLKGIEGFVIRHETASVFVPRENLAPSAFDVVETGLLRLID